MWTFEGSRVGASNPPPCSRVSFIINAFAYLSICKIHVHIFVYPSVGICVCRWVCTGVPVWVCTCMRVPVCVGSQ